MADESGDSELPSGHIDVAGGIVHLQGRLCVPCAHKDGGHIAAGIDQQQVG